MPVASDKPRKPLSPSEWAVGAAYAIVLFWVNYYVCRDFARGPVPVMNSMHGFWAAIAKWADAGWFHSVWWPFWDCGIPFEFTYAPLVPALTSIFAAARGLPEIVGFQAVTVLIYCVGPVTLFVMAWRLTNAPGFSFLASLFYSLTAPTELLVPDGEFALRHFWDARRLYLLSVWDDTPHALALAILPMAILFLARAIRDRRPVYYAAAAVSISIMTLASAFGPTLVIMAALCLLFVYRREAWLSNIFLTAAIGAYAYIMASPFFPPSLIKAIRAASERGPGGQWTAGSYTALAIIILGWTILWRYVPRWTSDWTLQFFALFAYLATSIPILETFLHRSFLPQPNRYKFEMEMGLALLLVFGVRHWVQKAPRSWRVALLFLALALAGEQLVSYRQFAKNALRSADLSQTIEYKASTWVHQNLNGVRVMMPGSVAQWANAFAPIPQFSGGSWSMAYNLIQQRGVDAVYAAADPPELDAQYSLAWLKAYGVGAVCVAGPKSPEFWKRAKHPEKFEGLLPVLWRESDTTIYRVPTRSASFAHVVPRDAIVEHSPGGVWEVKEVERLNAAMDDPALPLADLRWQGNNRIQIHADVQPQSAVFLQVSYHPGWHATAAGRSVALHRDGLGLMWMQPACSGPCDILLEYDGGWELRLCRIASLIAIAGGIAWLLLLAFRKRSPRRI